MINSIFDNLKTNNIVTKSRSALLKFKLTLNTARRFYLAPAV